MLNFMKLRYPYLHFQQIFPTSRPWNYQKLSETNYQELSGTIRNYPPDPSISGTIRPWSASSLGWKWPTPRCWTRAPQPPRPWPWSPAPWTRRRAGHGHGHGVPLNNGGYPLVNIQKLWKITIYSDFSHWKWWFSIANYGKSQFSMGKSTISMVIFHIVMLNYQRVILSNHGREWVFRIMCRPNWTSGNLGRLFLSHGNVRGFLWNLGYARCLGFSDILIFLVDENRYGEIWSDLHIHLGGRSRHRWFVFEWEIIPKWGVFQGKYHGTSCYYTTG